MFPCNVFMLMKSDHWYACRTAFNLRVLCLGELTREEDVLEWLVQNKSTGDEEDVIEDVTAKALDTLISSVDNLVVLFCELTRVFGCCKRSNRMVFRLLTRFYKIPECEFEIFFDLLRTDFLSFKEMLFLNISVFH